MNVELEIETGFSGGFSECCDPAVVTGRPPVEHDLVDSFFLGTSGDDLANFLSGSDIATVFVVTDDSLLPRVGGRDRQVARAGGVQFLRHLGLSAGACFKPARPCARIGA